MLRFLPAVTSLAIVLGHSCLSYAADFKLVVADGGGGNGGNDWLKIVNTNPSSVLSNPGPLSTFAVGTGTGTDNIEAIVFVPTSANYLTGTLFAVNENTSPNPDVGQFGTIDLSTGVFSSIGSGIGSGNGALGIQLLDDIDGLTIDPFSGIMYGTHRRGGADTPDLLFQIDRTTGSVIANAFGAGIDYVQVLPGTGNNADIDDITISSYDGQMYGVANGNGSGDTLVRIDKFTGALTTVGVMGIDDVEGLAFEGNGLMWGTTGTGGTSTTSNRIWSIDPTTGVASIPTGYDSTTHQIGSPGSDFESIAGLLDAPNTISGTVFYDANINGIFDSGTENGFQGIEVRLYRDVNLDGLVDINDILLDTKLTDVDGFYEWIVLATGAFVLNIDITGIPLGDGLTTDNIELANFGTSFGLSDPNNNFGFVPEPSTYLLCLALSRPGAGAFYRRSRLKKTAAA